MSALIEGRPTRLDGLFRPGNVFTFDMAWPAGELTGRSFSATLDAATLDVAIAGDTMTITATAAQTTTAGVGSHTFTLTETTGGASDVRVVGTWGGSTTGAVSPSDSVSVTTTAGTVSVTLTDTPAAPVVAHNWDVDGWDPFTEVIASNDSPNDYTYSVATAGRGRVTGQAANSDGNHRTWMLREGTLWADSEVCSLWWGGSVWDGTIATPQAGHVHRAVEDPAGTWTAYVVTNNIFGTKPNTVNLNVWQNVPGNTAGAITLGSNGGSEDFATSLTRVLSVINVRRFTAFGSWFNEYGVLPPHAYGLAAGDDVTTDVTDSTFDETAVAVSAVSPGLVVVVDPTDTAAVAVAASSGTLTPEDRILYWPYWVRSQLRGTVLRVKVWRYMDPEPDWGATGNVVSFDTAGAGDPAPNIAAAPTGPGLCGLVGAHLKSSAYLEYGETTFRQIRTGE